MKDQKARQTKKAKRIRMGRYGPKEILRKGEPGPLRDCCAKVGCSAYMRYPSSGISLGQKYRMKLKANGKHLDQTFSDTGYAFEASELERCSGLEKTSLVRMEACSIKEFILDWTTSTCVEPLPEFLLTLRCNTSVILSTV